jgi:hypothetical protein
MDRMLDQSFLCILDIKVEASVLEEGQRKYLAKHRLFVYTKHKLMTDCDVRFQDGRKASSIYPIASSLADPM